MDDWEYAYEKDVWVIYHYLRTRRPLSSPRGESHAQWAIEEILKRVYEEDQKLPYHISGLEPEPVTDIIREFIEEMSYYETIANSTDVLYFVMVAGSEAQMLLRRFERKGNV